METTMKSNTCSKLKMMLVTGLLGLAQSVWAVEVAGVKLDDTVRVANADIKLNGAGVRTKAIFKVYVAGLYLAEKKTTVADVLAEPGPKRISLVMLRDISADALGSAFMEGLSHNNTVNERATIINQMLKFGEMFAATRALKKGDIVTTDWIPGSGTLVQINGKKNAEIYPDVAFYNALLKIWLGDQPADSTLKKQLLGLELPAKASKD